MTKRIERIQMLHIARTEGIEKLRSELEKMEVKEIKATAKSNGYLGGFGRINKEDLIKELCRWTEAKTHYGECFRIELLKELEENNR